MCIVLNSGLDRMAVCNLQNTTRQHTHELGQMAMRQWLLEAAAAIMPARAMSTNNINSGSTAKTMKTTLNYASVMVSIAVCVVQLAVVLVLEHCLAVP